MNAERATTQDPIGLVDPPEPTRAERLAGVLATAPLLPAAIGMAIGILIDYECPLPVWAYAALFIVGGGSLIAARRQPLLCAAVLVWPAIGVGGTLHGGAYRRIAADHIVRYTDATSIGACLIGTIATAPSMSQPNFGAFNDFVPRPPRTRFLLEAQKLDGVSGPINISGLVQVGVAEPLAHLQAGDRVRVFGRLYRPVPPANPGEPDWPLYQRRRGVLAGFSCEHAANVARIGAPASEAGWLTRFRHHCRRLLLDDVVMPDPAGVSVLEAIILGQRSMVDRAINAAFVATGTVHILSVSGSHLCMLAGAVWALAALLGRSRRQSAWFVLVAVLVYAMLAEPNAPVLRSAITATFLCVGLMLRRPTRTANWLAASALLVLAVRPADLFDPGFQLSYVTLAGVIYLSGPIRDAWRRVIFHRHAAMAELIPASARPQGIRRFVRDVAVALELVLAVSVAAWLVGAPLSMYHFGQTSTWGWLNSLLIAPLVGLLMLAGFVKLIATAIWPATAVLFGPLLAAVTSLLDHWVRLLASIPHVSVMTPAPPLGLVVFALAVCGSWASRRVLLIPGHWIAIGLTVSVLGGLFWYLPGRPSDDELHVRLVSVGNGTATIIRLPNGRAFLYDAGSMPPYELYRSTLRPALGAERIRRLDAAIVSHPDLDHFSGLIDLAPHVPIRELWVPGDFSQREGAGKAAGPAGLLLAEFRRRGVPIRRLSAGDQLRGTGGVDVEVLWPPSGHVSDPRDKNESSIVLRLRHRGRSVLFCGDIEEKPQRWLIANADVSADVLVLPHHGSFKPWTADFVRAVSPTYVIRSSGKRTDISAAGLNDLMQDYEYFNTADVGGVLVRLARGNVSVSASRPRNHTPDGMHRCSDPRRGSARDPEPD
jgi:competence protein ComEC